MGSHSLVISRCAPTASRIVEPTEMPLAMNEQIGAEQWEQRGF